MSAPSVGLLENAANATFWGASTTAYGLTQLKTGAGAPMQIATASGCTAAAFRDNAGNVVISFQGTETVAQSAADRQLMTGTPGARIAAFQDAVDFTRQVEQRAACMGVAPRNIYVTGHSLGGVLAEYAASRTGLGGASFAGAGLPGYQAPATPASNFVSYVEHGDAFANWSTDGSEHKLVASGTVQDHYGRVVFLGPASNDVLTDKIIADMEAVVPAMFGGNLQAAVSKLTSDFTNNLMTIHGMNHYCADIAALPAPNFAAQTLPSGPQHLQAAVAAPAVAVRL